MESGADAWALVAAAAAFAAAGAAADLGGGAGRGTPADSTVMGALAAGVHVAGALTLAMAAVGAAAVASAGFPAPVAADEIVVFSSAGSCTPAAVAGKTAHGAANSGAKAADVLSPVASTCFVAATCGAAASDNVVAAIESVTASDGATMRLGMVKDVSVGRPSTERDLATA